MSTVERWLSMLGDSAIEAYPPLAVLAGWTSLLTGQTAAAERWAAMLETASFELVPLDGSASFESSRAMFRAAFCSAGPEQMLSDASFAVAQEPAGSPWLNTAVYLLAEAHLLTGDVDQAAALFVEASALAADDVECRHPRRQRGRARGAGDGPREVGGGGRACELCAGHDRRASDGRQRPERARLRRCGASRCAPRRPEAGECPAHAGDAGQALVQLGDAVSRRSVATTTRQGLLGHGRSCDGPSLVARDRRHPAAPTGTRRTRRRRLGASPHRHIQSPSRRGRSFAAHPGGAPAASVSPDTLHESRDRRALVRVPQHRQHPDQLDLSEARCLLSAATPCNKRRRPVSSADSWAHPPDEHSKTSSVSYPSANASLGAAATTHGNPTMRTTPTRTSTISATVAPALTAASACAP